MAEKWGALKKPFGYFIAGLFAAAIGVSVYKGVHRFFRIDAVKHEDGTAASPPVPLSENRAPANAVTSVSPALKQLRKTSESFRFVATRVGPAVVYIKATKDANRSGVPRRRANSAPENEDNEDESSNDPFFDFFQHFGNPFPFQPYGEETPQTSFGSGILIDDKGIVVTNNHVVEEASEILITLSGDDKTEMKAKVMGTDPATDLAVLALEQNQKFPFAEWADSDLVEVGDWAVAIGSPFALGQSVTLGIVSAKGRMAQGITGGGYGETLIQTDAAINPGNSGGPLCTLEGKVMGVNSAIYTRNGGYMGIGFAIPSNIARDIANKLITDGKIVRGWLGVIIQPVPAEVLKEMGIKSGVSIHQVVNGSPAAKSGLKAGDIVTEVDGRAPGEVEALQKAISEYKPGQKVSIKIISYSERKARKVNVTIGTFPEAAGANAKKSPEQKPDKLGLIVSSHGTDGVEIEAVRPGTKGSEIGLSVGDVITRINREPVDSVDSYERLISGAKRVFLEVNRRQQILFFQFVLPE